MPNAVPAAAYGTISFLGVHFMISLDLHVPRSVVVCDVLE
jgi:hypothetical protein